MSGRPPPEPAADAPAESRYEIVEELGRGGMGVVFRARDLRLDRFVAIKFLPRDRDVSRDAQQRFEREARAASALDHPNICTIHEIDETDDGQIFICMACYEGETLKDRIEQGPLPLDDALEITRQVAEGLAEAGSALHAQPVATRAQAMPGLLIYRFTHSMYYANSGQLSEELMDLVTDADPSIRWLCLDASAVDDVDYSAAETLRSLHGLLQEKGIRLVALEQFQGCPGL